MAKQVVMPWDVPEKEQQEPDTRKAETGKDPPVQEKPDPKTDQSLPPEYHVG